jgi:thiosulfate reductase/polysulfide reductase chain A
VQEFADCIGRRVPIIVVDPRYSVAASKAKYWLPIKPGTDLALVLAWMNVVVSEGRYDQAFVEKHGHGFAEFVEEIKHATPEWAAAETGIDAGLIRATAREFSSHRPKTIIHPGRRVVWNGDDTQRSRAVALLNMLMGNWGRKGGFYCPVSLEVPGYPRPKPAASGAKPVYARDIAYPFADVGEGVTTSIREATLTGKPYPIKAWVVYATDLMHALPNQQETLKAIQNLDLLVVIDTMPSDLAAYADAVLPDATFLERYDDLFVGWGRRGWMSLRQPVVKPPHDQKPSWWIAKALAGRLGVGEFFPWKDIEEYLAYRVGKAGQSWAELRKTGVVLGPEQPTCVEDGLKLEFATGTGKVNFYSEELKKAGFDPVPRYTRPEEAPAGHFRLITGRSPVHTFSRTQSNPYLADLVRENEVWVSPQVATAHGLENGKYARLRNQDGIESARVRVKVTQRIRPDCVYMVYGFGHRNSMRRHAHGRGASVAGLTTRYKVDPLTGGTSIHSNFVTFAKEP